MPDGLKTRGGMLCEAVGLPPLTGVLAVAVRHDEGAPAVERFPHYHDAVELVVFRHVQGRFLLEGVEHALQPGMIAVAASLQPHDFDLAPGPKSWVLLQIAPSLVAGLPTDLRAAYATGFCARPCQEQAARIGFLCEWLVDLVDGAPGSPLIGRIADLVLAATAAAPRSDGTPMAQHTVAVERFRPALDRLRAAPGAPIATEAAAAACHMSTAYFCRRFRSLFGLRFQDYVRTYRLQLAARRLTDGDDGVARIGYDLGFATPSHFGAAFRDRYGVSPRAFRKAGRAGRFINAG